MELRKVTRLLPHILTDEELRTKGDELAVTVQDLANEEINQKQIKDQLKLKLSELDARLGVLAHTISRRQEYQDTEVKIEFMETGDNVGQVRETRLDTGEVLTIRPPRDDERQPELMGAPGG